MKNALISVFNKNGITEFSKGLYDLGFNLISSGGTAKHLQSAGLSVTDVAEITGYPAILGHRVVTLHPSVHGGILALDTDEHNEELKKYKIPRFDLVCCDLYPVQDAIAKPDATVASVMEMTDIGGPTMIRAAAKNHERVIVICNPIDRQRVLDDLKLNGDLTSAFRRGLALEVFRLMAEYNAAIAEYLASQD